MRRVSLLFAGLAMAGCATTVRPALPPPDVGWEYSETPEEGAKLAYGVSETDNVAVMLVCPMRSGQVTIIVPVARRQGGRLIELRSGAARSRLPARRRADEGLGPALEAQTPITDAALQAFAESGQFVVDAGEGVMAMPARDAGPVRRFVAACKG